MLVTLWPLSDKSGCAQYIKSSFPVRFPGILNSCERERQTLNLYWRATAHGNCPLLAISPPTMRVDRSVCAKRIWTGYQFLLSFKRSKFSDKFILWTLMGLLWSGDGLVDIWKPNSTQCIDEFIYKVGIELLGQLKTEPILPCLVQSKPCFHTIQNSVQINQSWQM